MLLTILGCEIESEFDYAFIIAKSSYANGTFIDSFTFYYNSGDQLTHVDECMGENIDCREHTVSYGSNFIQGFNGSFYTNENNRIYKWIWNDMQVDYRYENDLIVYEKQFIDSIVANEHFYTYDGANLAKDSGIYYNRDAGQIHTTIYNYRYTDTIVPDFLIGRSGLFEYLLKHQMLIKECESTEQGILYRYTYDISENELVEHM